MREIFVKFLRSSLVAVNISHCEPFLVIYGTCFNITNVHKAWSQKLAVMNQFSPVYSKLFLSRFLVFIILFFKYFFPQQF